MIISIFNNLIKEDPIKRLNKVIDKARIKIIEVDYKESEKSLVIPMRLKTDKPAKLKINDINELKISDQRFDKIETITLLFGLKIVDNEIYLSSAEEEKGFILYEIKAHVERINIELSDTI